MKIWAFRIMFALLIVSNVALGLFVIDMDNRLSSTCAHIYGVCGVNHTFGSDNDNVATFASKTRQELVTSMEEVRKALDEYRHAIDHDHKDISALQAQVLELDGAIHGIPGTGLTQFRPTILKAY